MITDREADKDERNERRERLRPADEQNNNEETHTPDTIERQTENPKMTMAIKKTPHVIKS